MKILKFAGSSFRNLSSIERVLEILRKKYAMKEEFAIVVSAGRKTTDELVAIANLASNASISYRVRLAELSSAHRILLKEIGQGGAYEKYHFQLYELLDSLEGVLHGVFLVREASKKTLDFIMSFGERLTGVIMAHACNTKLAMAELIDAREFIVTDEKWGAATVDLKETYSRICNHFSSPRPLQIIPGFIGASTNGATTTLGRGGADYTASILGAALNSEELEFWTLVEGVMTADPRKVSRALPISNLTYEEAMELSNLGAKLLYPPTLQPAKDKEIPIRVLNLLNPSFPGTVISNSDKEHRHAITGISSIDAIALLRVEGSGLIGTAGFANRLFSCLSKAGVNVIFISQGASEYSICVAFLPTQASVAHNAVAQEFAEEIVLHKIEKILIEYDLSVVAVVGENMRKTPGIAARLFGALSRNGINSIAIAQGSSELNISVVIASQNLDKALRAVHDAFFLSDMKSVHLFLIGTGQVGGTLIEQIAENHESLAKHHSLDLRVIGLGNSTSMTFDPNGIDLQQWKDALSARAEKMDIDLFIAHAVSLNLPNCIFIDCTASENVASRSAQILKSSISLVTPNKKANSGTYSQYLSLKATAKQANVKFFYETNVGAGLPVIGTLNDLLISGDEVIKIEAVLSGTLSYIFNNYLAPASFSEVVRKAKDLGYTEPDPRDDLGGIDVARKLLILAREIGESLELSDISVESLIPEGGMNCKDTEEFLQFLSKHDEVFEKRRDAANSAGQVLRYIGIVQNGKAQVSLRAVGPEHPFYSLSGTDNVISFSTQRYKERPLVIKGPGAGTAVTAAGVLADVVRVASYLD